MNGGNTNTNGDLFADGGFDLKTASDRISDADMAEIIRRSKWKIAPQENGDIVSSITPPADTSKIWWPIDASGARIGDVPRIYDQATGQWIESGNADAPVTLAVRFGTDSLGAAVSQSRTISFAAMPSVDYFVTITPTSKVGSSYGAGSTNMDNFGFQIIAQAAESMTITFYNVPTGGLGFEWKVEQRPA